MSVFLSPVGGAGAQFFDNNGNPLTGGKIFTYAAGTTTPSATYTTSLGTTAWTNPIVLDAAGRVPGSGEIWLSESTAYKFVLHTSNDVLLATWDNIAGINDDAALKADLANTSDVAKGDALIGFKQADSVGAYTGAVGATVHQKLQDVVSAFDFLPAAQIAFIQARNTASQDATVVTAGINAALATGRGVLLPKGKYAINSSLQLTAEGQVLRGEGRYDCTHLLWVGGTGDTFIETNNTNLKWHCEVREMRLTFNADGMTGIDWSNVSYGTLENVNIDGYGNNVVGVRLKGNGTYGDRPYYNTFRQIDIASNNIGGVTSGSIGWYGQRSESPIEAGNFNGPNANQWFGGRCSGMSKAFYFEDAVGNSFFGCVSESVKTSHFEFGVATPYYPAVGGAAVFAATVNTLTDNSSIPMTTNQYVNGMLYILSGTGAGQYRQILTNTTSVFTVYPYWDVVPDNTSTYQLFPEAGQNNTIQGCYGEGDATSSPDYLKLHPGAVSAYIYGGLQTSLGTIIDDVPRVGNRFNPGGWKDPVAFTFSTVDLPKNSSNLALAPVGWLRNNLSIPGYWHVSAIDVGINGAITSGTIKIWVTQNGAKINTNPDMQITSLSSFNTGGGSIKQGIYSTNAIVSTSGYSQFGVQVDTDSILLPDATLDLYVTLYVVARG